MIFAEKFCPWERTFDNLEKFPGGLPEGCWRLELTDASIGNEVVSCFESCLYLLHGYDVIFSNCVVERSKQCENWNDVVNMNRSRFLIFLKALIILVSS